MKIMNSEAAGGIQPAYTPAVTSKQNARGAQNAEQTGAASFDQVNITGELSSEGRFQKELAARLVRDVRSATSTGNIQQLREQVRAGLYRADPAAIAGAMLLEG